MDLRLAGASILTLVAVTGAVVARAATAAPPTIARAATPDERLEIALAVAANEPGWRDESAQGFPRDHWSQRDDFHGREMKKLRELAGQKGVRIEDVLRAVDDDLHATRADAKTPDARNARAVPCKPRPFYD